MRDFTQRCEGAEGAEGAEGVKEFLIRLQLISEKNLRLRVRRRGICRLCMLCCDVPL
jgi:hypothetical protein